MDVNQDPNNYAYQTGYTGEYTGQEATYDPNAAMAGDTSDPYAGLDDQQREALQEQFRAELAKTEEEIATLRQVLASKTKTAQELKRKLGISGWKEWTTDLSQGVKNLQETSAMKDINAKITQWNREVHESPIIGGISSTLGTFTSPAYQKTSEALSGVAEKSTSLFGGLGGGLAKKLGEVRSSTSFKSFEDRVVGSVGSVKSKLTGSRSNSTNSFEEALNSMEAQRAQQGGAVDPNQMPQQQYAPQ